MHPWNLAIDQMRQPAPVERATRADEIRYIARRLIDASFDGKVRLAAIAYESGYGNYWVRSTIMSDDAFVTSHRQGDRTVWVSLARTRRKDNE